MTTCRCNRPLLATGHCQGCNRTPSWCRCPLTTAERVPLWVQRQRRGELPAKELAA